MSNRRPLEHFAPFAEQLADRRSVREFAQDPVDPEIITDALRLAQRAPTISNHQPYSVVCVSDPAKRVELTRSLQIAEFAQSAPVWLLFCIDWSRQDLLAAHLGLRNEIPPTARLLIGATDTSIFCQTAALVFEQLGLGTIMLIYPWLDLTATCDILGITGNAAMPFILLLVGYSAERPKQRPRYPLEALSGVDKYPKPDEGTVADFYSASASVWESDGNLDSEKYRRYSGGDVIRNFRDHFAIKFGEKARVRTWLPFIRQIRAFFPPDDMTAASGE